MTQPASAPYRVLIVDDVPAVREALRWRIGDESDMSVVGEAGSGREAIDRTAEQHPDVVILDIEMPDLDGYAVARQLKAMGRPPIIIFLSVHSDPLSRQQALEAGGDGFAEKSQGWLSLIGQIRQALARRPY